MNGRIGGTFLAASISAISIPSLLAQEGAIGPLEEVIVTATRREENLQDVPISVNVISGEAIQQGGFADMQELSTFVPNLWINEELAGQKLFIRGIGTLPHNAAFEQAVAQFHDNVAFTRDNLSQNALFDLEAVEVVRGPQPLFAGQSATAGAIRYVSRRPGDTVDVNLRASYGSAEETDLEFAIGGPVSDTFGLRFAGRFYDLTDADYTHAVTGAPLNLRENTAARLLGVWSPSDEFELTFKFERHDIYQQGAVRDMVRCETRPQYSRSHPFLVNNLPAACALDAAYHGIEVNAPGDRVGGGGGPGGNLDIYDVINALNAASGAAPGDPNFWPGVDGEGRPLPGNRIVENADQLAQFNEQERNGQLVDVALVGFGWDIGEYTLSAQLSLVEYEREKWADPDASALAILQGDIPESFEQTSYEVSLASPLDQTFSWLIGAYWQDHDLDSSSTQYGAWQLGPALAATGNNLKESSTWASVFFSSVWNISDSVRLNLGARWQDVSKNGTLTPHVGFANAAFNAFGPLIDLPPVEGLSVRNDDVLPEVSLEWDSGDNTMLYAKYAEAFKAGGFVLAPAPGGMQLPKLDYGPESAEAFELGLKSRVFDGMLELNIAAFNQNYTDLQVSVFDVTTSNTITLNAAAVYSRGIEVDGRWAVSDGFSLGFSASLNDGEIEDWPGASCDTLEIKLAAQAHPGESCESRNNAAGEELENLPSWTITLFPEFVFGLTDALDGRLSASLMISDGFSSDTRRDPITNIEGFERIDLRLGILPTDGNWDVAVYGRNLTDNRNMLGSATYGSFSSGTTLPDYDGGAAYPGQRSRNYGVQLSYYFN